MKSKIKLKAGDLLERYQENSPRLPENSQQEVKLPTPTNGKHSQKPPEVH